MIKKLSQYPDSEVFRVTINKLCGHLWYIAPENMAFAFFDSRIPNDVKLKIANSILSVEKEENTIVKNLVIHPKQVNDFIKKEFMDLVCPETINFFKVQDPYRFFKN